MARTSKSCSLAVLISGSLTLGGCVTADAGSLAPTIGASPSSAVLAVEPAAQSAPSAGFAAFLADIRAESLATGVSPATLDRALTGVSHLDRVIELDRRQPEFTLSFSEYLGRVVTPARVAEGKRRLAENRDLLERIEHRYGVQPRFVVAMWGIETGYGRNTGGMPVIASLATLAYDGRRSSYFRRELLTALQILDQGHIAPSAMVGSWAGAMGQCQFMPSTFARFAVDWSGDGRRDIWTNHADALASAANYLAAEGWKDDQSWGRAVRIPAGLSPARFGLDKARPLAEWSRLGVRTADGKALPKSALVAALIEAEPGKGPTFLVYDNFRTIMKWNRSTFFALAAGHLADRIGDR